MDHHDHVNLLRPALLDKGGSWADLGAGSGAFTFALRELIGPTSTIYAVDKDRASLDVLKSEYLSRFGSHENLHLQVEDFSRTSSLPALDGILVPLAEPFFIFLLVFYLLFGTFFFFTSISPVIRYKLVLLNMF